MLVLCWSNGEKTAAFACWWVLVQGNSSTRVGYVWNNDWRSTLVVHIGCPLWWSTMVVHISGPHWWSTLMVHIGGPLWWSTMVVHQWLDWHYRTSLRLPYKCLESLWSLVYWSIAHNLARNVSRLLSWGTKRRLSFQAIHNSIIRQLWSVHISCYVWRMRTIRTTTSKTTTILIWPLPVESSLLLLLLLIKFELSYVRTAARSQDTPLDFTTSSPGLIETTTSPSSGKTSGRVSEFAAHAVLPLSWALLLVWFCSRSFFPTPLYNGTRW